MVAGGSDGVASVVTICNVRKVPPQPAPDPKNPRLSKFFHLTYYYFHAMTDTTTSLQCLITSYYWCQCQCSH